MIKQHIGPYQRDIMGQLDCSAEDASMVEDIMRNHVFHSTLDWQTAAQFRRGAREAWKLLEAEREMFEEYYRGVRRAFEEMRTAEVESDRPTMNER